MTQQYLRQLSLIVANDAGRGFDFGSFWCTFNVRRDDFQSPNSCDCRVFNLSTTTANTIAKTEFTTISLSAGYPANFGQWKYGVRVQRPAARLRLNAISWASTSLIGHAGGQVTSAFAAGRML
jgi:hypothetical protein